MLQSPRLHRCSPISSSTVRPPADHSANPVRARRRGACGHDNPLLCITWRAAEFGLRSTQGHCTARTARCLRSTQAGLGWGSWGSWRPNVCHFTATKLPVSPVPPHRGLSGTLTGHRVSAQMHRGYIEDSEPRTTNATGPAPAARPAKREAVVDLYGP